jgi:hypothetical protein
MSVIVHVTVVTPGLNTCPLSVDPPDGKTVAPVNAYAIVNVQLSVATGFHVVPVCVYVQVFGFILTVWFAGHVVTTGGTMSETVTVKEQVVVLPAPSVAVQVTVVVPKLKS